MRSGLRGAPDQTQGQERNPNPTPTNERIPTLVKYQEEKADPFQEVCQRPGFAGQPRGP